MAEEQTAPQPPPAHLPDQPAVPPEPKPVTQPPHQPSTNRWQRFKHGYIKRKKWAIPATVILFLLLIMAIPGSRYGLAGLVVKKDITVHVLDSETNTPVSGVRVSLGTASAETDGTGKALLARIKAGHHKLLLSKKYYKDKIVDILSPILTQKGIPNLAIVATGRQVEIRVSNAINGSPVGGANIGIAGSDYKTAANGIAVVVVPAGSSSQKAAISHDGYNNVVDVNVNVSNNQVAQNDIKLVPKGKVYFLSKLSGKIDVVKTNLDGSERQTVLAGTGREDDQNTVLLASRDWKYLALLSKRAGSNPSLYLIDTSDDSLSTIDEGSADFSLAGWVDDSFVYTITRSNVNLWQAGRQVIKSFNAPTKKLNSLDQTAASGTSQFDYVTELVGDVYAYDSQVYYIKNWSSSVYGDSSAQLANKQATFNTIKPDGTAKKALRSFGVASGSQAIDITLEQRVENPGSIHLKFSDGTKDNFYIYTNGQVKDDSAMTADKFYTANYPTYLESPSGNNTFWSEPRDGKNTLFIGDETGQNSKQIATLSDYFTYGWYTDNYLLISKNSSELYIMPKGGSANPVKVSDYHKPVQNYFGYGGGYGGI